MALGPVREKTLSGGSRQGRSEAEREETKNSNHDGPILSTTALAIKLAMVGPSSSLLCESKALKNISRG